MNCFSYKKGNLYAESVPVARIAKDIGTPFYCYSYNSFIDRFTRFSKAFSTLDPLVCFSVKSNSNLAVLKSLVKKGAGLDIVSGGELYRGLKAGVSPKKVVYAGVGKSESEIEYAVKKGILLFNVESEGELRLIDKISSGMGKRVDVALRVNPDIDAGTHPYITTARAKNKFGIDLKSAAKIYLNAGNYKSLNITGLHIHIGSQITSVSPFVKALKKILLYMDDLRKKGVEFKYLNLGGGIGIRYKDEKVPDAEEFAAKIVPMLSGWDLRVIFEPGRFIAGNSGIFVTSVLYVKDANAKKFIIVDGAMNDLIRPSLYGAYHRIEPVEAKGGKKEKFDIVGPICESGDFLGKDRKMSRPSSGDLLSVFSAGAYGFVMSGTYNSRPKVAEVLVKGNKYFVIRKREDYKTLVKGEFIPDFIDDI